jgi:hypothetical protein
MRDKDYELQRPAGTIRMALLGGSISVAWRVEVEKGYESLLESQLIRDQESRGGPSCEILNFSVGGHGNVNRLQVLEQTVFSFEPQIVLFTHHLQDVNHDLRYLSEYISTGFGYPESLEIVQSAGVTESTPTERVQALLQPKWNELRAFCFQRAVELCHRRGIKIALIVLPSGPKEGKQSQVKEVVELGKQIGFDAIFDLTGIYHGHPYNDLKVAENDNHPSAKAHRLIFESLYQELISDPILSAYLKDSTTESTSASAP